MSEEASFHDRHDPSPAIATCPDPIVSRRLHGLVHLQRLLLGAGAALAIGVALVLYVSGARRAVLPSAVTGPTGLPFKLPPLDVPLPKPPPPPSQESIAPAETVDASVQPTAETMDVGPNRVRREQSLGMKGTVAHEATTGPESGPVLWRNRQDLGPGPARDTGDARPDRTLLPSGYEPAHATRLPPSTRVLAKGTAVGCTLETAIDSQLPGLVTCLIGIAVYGSDGQVQLLPRGTRLLGEARSEARTGQSRVYVLWVEARTPDGVLVPLASPGTDALGRAGVPGQVDTHFFDRFGAAMLISIMDAGTQLAATRAGNGGVIVAPQSSEAILTEVLRNTVAIPPTIRVQPGAQVSVLVARDVDFGSTNVSHAGSE